MRREMLIRGIVVTTAFASPWVLGAAPAPPAQLDPAAAEAAFQRQDWPAALPAFEALVQSPEASAAMWMKLAAAQRGLGRYDAALASLDRAKAKGLPLPQFHLQRVRTFLRRGELDQAFHDLDQAVAAGFGGLALLASDPELAPLGRDPRMRAIYDRLDAGQRPCLADPTYRKFDFWIGEWDVRGAGSSAAAAPATSSIQMVMEGCAILENYRNGAYLGTSHTSWDAARKHWVQNYVDSSGLVARLEGDFDQHGTLILESDVPPQNGQPSAHTRLSFFRVGPDQVRQLWEQTLDQGKTWTVLFDGDYRRKNATR